ncbi:unnamed protein product [Zymoseptoria tritici ST99CH_1E4]|uniref:Uncharacterized protein n=1 Tax=Zymoseptoria tritici ST99CH_1E4 TaxID=1276532 RepID=A0A2H1FZJ9_ZYMTR|nr:unnamed protein product [Zymoseptoria tritici ST99CH_1E4]
MPLRRTSRTIPVKFFQPNTSRLDRNLISTQGISLVVRPTFALSKTLDSERRFRSSHREWAVGGDARKDPSGGKDGVEGGEKEDLGRQGERKFALRKRRAGRDGMREDELGTASGHESEDAKREGEGTISHDQPSLPASDEALEVSTFGGLVSWATPLHTADLTTILIRHHDSTPLHVQSHLLASATDSKRAYLLPTKPTGLGTEYAMPAVLDLTPFPTEAGLVFAYWVVERYLPSQTIAALPSTPQVLSTPMQGPAYLLQPSSLHPISSTTNEKERDLVYLNGLTQTYRLGAALGSPKSQNEVLKRIARDLEREEEGASRSSDPRVSIAVRWARDAWDLARTALPSICEGCGVPVGEGGHFSSSSESWDGLGEDSSQVKGEGRRKGVEEWGAKLADFAVDVAARRVWVVGKRGLVLTREERGLLGGDAVFAGEVLARVGGQVGMKGVRVGECVGGCLVEEV